MIRESIALASRTEAVRGQECRRGTHECVRHIGIVAAVFAIASTARGQVRQAEGIR